MNHISRRSFLQKSQMAGTAATAFTIIKPELVRGAGKELLKDGKGKGSKELNEGLKRETLQLRLRVGSLSLIGLP